jgi:hypothetical protein
VTTGILGRKEVLAYLGSVARLWGFTVAGQAGLVTPIPLPPHRASENGRAIARAAAEFSAAIGNSAPKRPGLSDILVFEGQRAAFAELESVSPADYRYWKEKGWFDRGTRYFTDVPVNPVYHAIGVAVGRFTARQVRSDLVRDTGGES